jgi:hypothetical protein
MLGMRIPDMSALSNFCLLAATNTRAVNTYSPTSTILLANLIPHPTVNMGLPNPYLILPVSYFSPSTLMCVAGHTTALSS